MKAKKSGPIQIDVHKSLCSLIKWKFQVWKREVLGDNTSGGLAWTAAILIPRKVQKSNIKCSLAGGIGFYASRQINEVHDLQKIENSFFNNIQYVCDIWQRSQHRNHGKLYSRPFHEICVSLGTDSTDPTIFHLQLLISHSSQCRWVMIITILLSPWSLLTSSSSDLVPIGRLTKSYKKSPF